MKFSRGRFKFKAKSYFFPPLKTLSKMLFKEAKKRRNYTSLLSQITFFGKKILNLFQNLALEIYISDLLVKFQSIATIIF